MPSSRWWLLMMLWAADRQWDILNASSFISSIGGIHLARPARWRLQVPTSSQHSRGRSVIQHTTVWCHEQKWEKIPKQLVSLSTLVIVIWWQPHAQLLHWCPLRMTSHEYLLYAFLWPLTYYLMIVRVGGLIFSYHPLWLTLIFPLLNRLLHMTWPKWDCYLCLKKCRVDLFYEQYICSFGSP